MKCEIGGCGETATTKGGGRGALEHGPRCHGHIPEHCNCKKCRGAFVCTPKGCHRDKDRYPICSSCASATKQRAERKAMSGRLGRRYKN